MVVAVDSAYSACMLKFPLLLLAVMFSVTPQGQMSQETVKTAPAPSEVRESMSGGTFTISPDVIAGGGGSSTGGQFTIEGTIGQAVAGGEITGGTYSVYSGFWTPTSSAPATNKRRGQITSQE